MFGGELVRGLSDRYKLPAGSEAEQTNFGEMQKHFKAIRSK